MAEIVWDQHALATYIVLAEDELLPGITQEVEEMARSLAPVRVRHTPPSPRSRRLGIGVPGKLKASVQSDVGRDDMGAYGDVAALWYGRFLDPPARQIKRLFPFLPTALMWVVDGKDFRL